MPTTHTADICIVQLALIEPICKHDNLSENLLCQHSCVKGLFDNEYILNVKGFQSYSLHTHTSQRQQITYCIYSMAITTGIILYKRDLDSNLKSSNDKSHHCLIKFQLAWVKSSLTDAKRIVKSWYRYIYTPLKENVSLIG